MYNTGGDNVEEFINKIATTEKNITDILSEVGRVLNEFEKKARENKHFKDRLVRWDEVGDHQYFRWELEIGIIKIEFDINDLINNIEPERDEAGFPIESNEIDVSKVEEAVKKTIITKTKI